MHYFLIFIMKTINILFISIIVSNLSIAAAGSTSSNIYFKANFVGGTCEIIVPSIIQFNGGEMLMPSEIRQQLPKAIESFNLTLSNCSGLGLMPTISVSGESTTNLGTAVFRNLPTQIDADGYGVLLSTVGNSSFQANANLAENNNIISKNWDLNKNLNTIDKNIPMKAVLTCGNCISSTLRGGEFSATVTFNFVYE